MGASLLTIFSPLFGPMLPHGDLMYKAYYKYKIRKLASVLI